MNTQRYVNAIDATVRTQMEQLVDAVRTEQQRQFLDIINIFMQRGSVVENAQRVLPSFTGVDMGFVHSLHRKMKEYNNWHARELGALPKPEDVTPKTRGRPPVTKEAE